MRITGHIALVVGLLLIFCSLETAAEELGTRRTVYRCDIGTGLVYSVEPCAPGKEIESKDAIVYPSGIIDFAPPAKATIDISPKPNSVNTAPQASVVAGAAELEKDQASNRQRLALFTLIAYGIVGLVFGVIAKLRRRSFLRWFVVGFVLALMFNAKNVVRASTLGDAQPYSRGDAPR